MTDYITTDEAAKLTGYHREHIRRLIRRGKIRAQKFGTTGKRGGVLLVSRASVLAYYRELQKAGGKRGPKRRKRVPKS
jgi:excisionase family DNA binding protein